MRVSVVINTLNRRQWLAATLDALLVQTYPSFEVIVVDGPSIDGTTEMVRAGSWPVRLFRCPEAHLGKSRNIGLRHSAGDVVAFIDDDALPPADWITQLVAGYHDHNVGGVGGAVFDVPSDRVVWGLCTCDRLGRPDARPSGEVDGFLGRGADPFVYFAGCNMSFRRTVLVAAGGFDERLSYGYDDVDICRRIVDLDLRLELLDAAVVRHERAPSNVRDQQRRITDPSPLLFAQAVFATGCSPTTWDDAAVMAALDEASAQWRQTIEALRADGELDEAEFDDLAARLTAAVRNGVAAGRGPRPRVSFDDPDGAAFRTYR
jgi:hypothetical protein